MKNYETKRLETERLIIDKGTSEVCKKIYEYDLTKCTGIDGRNELVKCKKEIDFIGDNPDRYYKECENDKLFDWYIFLKTTNTFKQLFFSPPPPPPPKLRVNGRWQCNAGRVLSPW